MFLSTGNNSLPASVICWYILQTVWTQIRPNETSGPIWIQTIWHSGDIPERNFVQKLILKKSQQTTI